MLCPRCNSTVPTRNHHLGHTPGETRPGWSCAAEPQVRSGAEIEQQARARPNPEAVDRRSFLDALAARLEVGALEYGNASFDKPMATTSAELEAEALDIAGWAYVMWVQLRRRCERLQCASE